MLGANWSSKDGDDSLDVWLDHKWEITNNGERWGQELLLNGLGILTFDKGFRYWDDKMWK